MTTAVGVANCNEGDMMQMADELAKYDIPLATNQCKFSVLRRHPETQRSPPSVQGAWDRLPELLVTGARSSFREVQRGERAAKVVSL